VVEAKKATSTTSHGEYNYLLRGPFYQAIPLEVALMTLSVGDPIVQERTLLAAITGRLGASPQGQACMLVALGAELWSLTSLHSHWAWSTEERAPISEVQETGCAMITLCAAVLMMSSQAE